MNWEELYLKAFLDTIPQLFEDRYDTSANVYTFRSAQITRSCFIPFTPQLNNYKDSCMTLSNAVYGGFSSPLNERIEYRRIQEIFVKIWLKQETKINNWDQALAYFNKIESTTVENIPIVKNIIINPTIYGSAPGISASTFDKTLAWLGSSPYTYIKVDENMNLIDFNGISINSIADTTSYKLYPEFLHPIITNLQEGEVVVSINRLGDLIISDKEGIVASRRKSNWTVYDKRTLKNNINNIFQSYPGFNVNSNKYYFGCNLFELLFDISFKRHGALIVFSPGIQKSSLANSWLPDNNHAHLQPLLPNFNFSNALYSIPEKRKLVEASSVDGSIMVDAMGIVRAFGAMLKPHSNVPPGKGARTTAAISAVLNGAISFKVSSDGEISIFFRRTHTPPNEWLEMEFL